MLFPSEPGLDPTGPWRFVVEIEVSVSTWTAVPGGAGEVGRLRRPGERLLFGSEVGEMQDDFIHGAWGSGMVGFHLLLSREWGRIGDSSRGLVRKLWKRVS
jgi:hypothetical protein